MHDVIGFVVIENNIFESPIIIKGNVRTVKLLATNGANLNLANNVEHSTPLMAAITNGSLNDIKNEKTGSLQRDNSREKKNLHIQQHLFFLQVIQVLQSF